MKTKNGFTLIEMLVVIAMIALLMAMITSALYQARLAAQKTRAETQLRDLVAAWGSYYMNEKQFGEGQEPDLPGTMLGGGWEDMTRTVLEKYLTVPNAKGFVYLNLSDAQFKNDEYVDPWGRVYQVTLNSAEGDVEPPDVVVKAGVSFLNKNRE